jgi:hypothetical protein
MSRQVVGSVRKGTDGRADYIKFTTDLVIKQGDCLNLEDKETQLENIKYAVEKGKLSAEMAEKITAKVEKMPDFIRFEITKSVKNT